VNCPKCQAEVLDIDVKCGNCGTALGATGAQRMIGNTVLGQYELVDVLGQGGMSVVFKAKHKMTDQEVALKILPPELAAHSQVKGRFLDEAKALAALDHPNIVHLYNFGQENGSFVLAMQFVQGKTWERLILENKRLDWKVTCRITIDVLRALEYAHGRGVVHRDMKPSNVLVRAQDGSATVMDFGIAKMAQSTRLTATGQTMGTVRYMSPEQVRGQEVDLRTDIYSLGATVYESLVGDTPFDGETHFEIMTKHLSELPKRPSARGVEVPQIIEDALMRSLAKKATDRFETARDMRKVLEQALKENDIGLVETQRLQREMLGDVRSARASAPPPQRAATASDLADELEPGFSGARRRGGRAKWALLAAAIVLAGGGTVAALLLHGKSGDAKKAKPPIEIPGVALSDDVAFPDLHVKIATDGTLTPAEVADGYKQALSDFRAYAKKKMPALEVVDPFARILVVPPRVLCEPTLYGDERLRENCSKRASTVPDRLDRTLLVAADPKRLRDAMRSGVADGVCQFQPVSGSDVERQQRFQEICEMTSGFGAP
jgi:tRNA A-37 threonylcarbamoyl transferase component Bud32